MKALLLTGRSLKQGIGKEVGKVTEKYKESVAMCEIHPKDVEELGIKDGENVSITTKFGSVVVKSVSSQNIAEPGIIFIPYGPYASMLVDYDTCSTGMPTLKGIVAEVKPAPSERILDVKELVKYLGR
ncbi:MAG: hypothetical protein HXX80_03195 [Nitrososphaerales archaeon]|nr:hypothetical protein [Nitrososphaerales archaeon]